MALVQASYDEQMLRLNGLEEAAKEAMRLQQEAVYRGEEAMTASAKTVYEANKSAVDYQRKKTEQAYIEMTNLQELDNKKRQTTLELTMSRFGTYDFSQLKGYQEQIMQNTQKVLNIKKEADLEDQKFTDEVRNVNLQYNEQLTKVQSWKAEALSATYSDYLDYVTALAKDENMTTAQKYEAMTAARDKANTKIADLNAKSLELQHEAAYDAAQRAEELVVKKNEAVVAAQEWKDSFQEKYKAEMETLLGNYVGTEYSSLDAGVKNRLRELEKNTQLPPGFMEAALTRLNKEASKEEFEWHGTETDNEGNLTAIGTKNGMPVAIPLGKVAKTTYPSTWDLKTVGGEAYRYNEVTGEYSKLTPADYDELGDYIGSQAISTVVGQAIASAYPDGSQGGQCGDFMHKFVDMTAVPGGRWGDPIGTKKSKMNMSTEQVQGSVQAGDVILTNENRTYGHIMIVNEVLEGGKVRVTESNYRMDEKVSNTRILDINSGKVVGGYRGPLKEKFETEKKTASENMYFDVADTLQKYGTVSGLAKTAYDYVTSGEGEKTSGVPGIAAGGVPQGLTAQQKLNYLADTYGVVLTGEKKKQLTERNSQAYFEKIIEEQTQKADKVEKGGRISLDDLL